MASQCHRNVIANKNKNNSSNNGITTEQGPQAVAQTPLPTDGPGVLAAMGRYHDAVVWLTHPQKLPTRVFRRSSALLEIDAAMNQFLDELSIRSTGVDGVDGVCGYRHRHCRSSKEVQTMKNSGTTPPPPSPSHCAVLKVPPTASSSTSRSTSRSIRRTTSSAMILSNTKVWSNLLHSVDRRLNEGMAGNFHVAHTRCSSSSSCSSSRNDNWTRSNSGSAIYLLSDAPPRTRLVPSLPAQNH